MGIGSVFCESNESIDIIKLNIRDRSEEQEQDNLGGCNGGNIGAREEDKISKCVSELNISGLLGDNQECNSEGIFASNFGVDGVQRTYIDSSGRFQHGLKLWSESECRQKTKIKKLKSSLKLSSNFQSSCNLVSISSSKNVRFASQLTRVKHFDLNSKPISISSERSPSLTCLDQLEQGGDEFLNKFLFGASSFEHMKLKLPLNKSIPKFILDYDSDDSDEKKIEDNDRDDNFSSLKLCDYQIDLDYDLAVVEAAESCEDEAILRKCSDQINVGYWELESSNLKELNLNDSHSSVKEQIYEILECTNIKLGNFLLVDNHRIDGLIYVNNLHFEKFIEVKFSFNGWNDIHHVTSQYLRTFTSEIDEFTFTIDLSKYKYFMKVDKITDCDYNAKNTWCPVKMELCCRYDVSGETYYDNNNYENYRLNIKFLTKPSSKFNSSNYHNKVNDEMKFASNGFSDQKICCKKLNPRSMEDKKNKSNVPLRKSFSYDFLLNLTKNTSYLQHILTDYPETRSERIFSDGTDYFNNSPLKNLYKHDITEKNKNADHTENLSCIEPQLYLSNYSNSSSISDKKIADNKDQKSLLLDNEPRDFADIEFFQDQSFYSTHPSHNSYSYYNYSPSFLTNNSCFYLSSAAEDSDNVSILSKKDTSII